VLPGNLWVDKTSRYGKRFHVGSHRDLDPARVFCFIVPVSVLEVLKGNGIRSFDPLAGSIGLEKTGWNFPESVSRKFQNFRHFSVRFNNFVPQRGGVS